MTQRNANSGFTLVELMLSMTFISVLLLAIAMLTIHINGIYSKGITLRAVNQSGQLISSDVQHALNQSIPEQVAFEVTNATGGRLCTGTTVYAWTFPDSFTDAGRLNKYALNDDPIRFVKFTGDAEFCTSPFPAVPSTGVTDLLEESDRDLAVHALDITSSTVSDDASQMIYEITMRLGTNTQSVISSGGDTCGSVVLSDQENEYCAINTLVFTARAGNKELGG